jgi:hypothetical protein
MFDCRTIEVLDSESESKVSVWFVVATVVVVVVVVVEDSVAGTSRYVTTNGLCPNSLIAFTRKSSRSCPAGDVDLVLTASYRTR